VQICSLCGVTFRENIASIPTCCCACYDSSIGKIIFRVESDYVAEQETKQVDPELMNFEDNIEQKSFIHDSIPLLYNPTQNTDVSLSKFLSRPVLIDTIAWTQGAFPSSVISPWHKFFNHASIKRKLDNYAYIRCDLKIKVVVNASPFYYGAGIWSYTPLNQYGAGAIDSADSAGRDNLISQRPHIWIYPQECMGGELTLPFLYNKEWLDVTNATTLQDMGQGQFRTIVSVRTVGSGTGNAIDVQIFAWAENVQLAGATVSLAVQGDEYKKNGPISKPASAIARASGLLSKLPDIGPFATATSIGANAIANIAALFGFTKVPSVENTQPVKNMPFRAFANSDIGDVMDKLSVDCKNELSVDRTVLGDPLKDYMIISNMVQHSSLLTNFTWTAAQAYNTLLWNAYVSPVLSRSVAGTGQSRIYGTPMWLLSNMFANWRGDIIYDFKVVCTKFHKGRLRIAWDPTGDISSTPDSYTEVNNVIIDISEQTQFSIRVPYIQDVAYSKMIEPADTEVYKTTALAPFLVDYTTNGIIAVFVMNEQSSPLTSADIQVLVSVRGAENLEFANPKEIDNTLSLFTVQSDFVRDDTKECTLGIPSKAIGQINLIYMGEKISSLRELLQRTNYSDSLPVLEEATSSKVAYFEMNRRPLFNGYDLDGIHTATGIVSTLPETYNFVKPTPYTLLANCFVGERGSITWHINVDGFEETTVNICRSNTLLTIGSYNLTFTPTMVTSSTASREGAYVNKSNAGMMMTHQFTNSGSSAIVPMYSQLTMLETGKSTRTYGKTDVSDRDSVLVSWTNHEWKDRGNDTYLVHKYYNVGPDHSFLFFLNVPTFYRYTSYPTA